MSVIKVNLITLSQAKESLLKTAFVVLKGLWRSSVVHIKMCFIVAAQTLFLLYEAK